MGHAAFAAAPPAAEVQRRRVLLADDTITTRTMEKHILENAGFQVRTAADGQEAWNWLRQHPADAPALVISDINMPHMDGLQLVAAIRADAHYAHLPIVLVSSLDSSEDRRRGLEVGADAYLTKGAFDQHELLQTIERLIG